MRTIFNEEIDVWRPVIASKELGSNVHLISLNNEVPEGERWEFLPGSIVLVKEKIFDNKSELVAYEMAFQKS